MNPTLPRLLALVAVLSPAAAVLAQSGKAPFTVDDLVRIKRVSDLQSSPDGRYVAFVLRETDMGANKGRTDLWLVDLYEKAPQPRQLTTDPANDSSPRWAPDSRTIYFLSTRTQSSQVWRLSLEGGEQQQVTRYPLSVDALKVSPTGKHLAVTMEVMPDCANLQCTKDQLEQEENSKATGQIYDRVFVRHWDTWKNGTRSHLFTVPLSENDTAGAPVDVSGKLDADVPSKPFGDDEDFDFSPDGTRIVFSARAVGRSEPWSTNFDLYEVPVDGSAEPKNLTATNPAWDAQPTFLKNGDLAYLAMQRPGFESDRFHLVIRSARTGTARHVTQGWDRSIGDLIATSDNKRVLAAVDDVGQHVLYSIDVSTGAAQKLVETGQVTDAAAVRNSVVLAWASLGAPADLYSLPIKGGELRRLSSVNSAMLDQRALSEFEQFSFAGWNDETVYGYVMKPHGFEAGKRYPIAFVVHGGPQVSFQNQWNYRWNAQTFAGRGYGVVLIDFHGSPGYGQKFTDSISGDWGGKPLVDLQKGLAAAIARYSWLDGERACALGASYGGFMMNWIAGNWPERFRCLVNHDGIFDQRMMYYSTEELWFTEWEHGGPYYERAAAHEKFNPANHVTAWRTPMLVIHGAQDFRVPLDQGIATFTALQRRGIESRFLYFPDENHWVLKPANSVLWYNTVLDWLDQHLKPERVSQRR
jgi:dipeptidyl aminopeptidase/acylaminoacyl peptidase